MKYHKLFASFMLIMLTGFMASCSAPLYNNAAHNVTHTQDDIAHAEEVQTFEARHKRKMAQAKRHHHKHSRAVKPYYLREHVRLRGKELPFYFYVNQLMKGTGVVTAYGPEVDKNHLMSMSFSGTRSDALRALAIRSGNVYTLRDRVLRFKAYVTRTFDISFMPGTSSYLVGKKADHNNSSSYGSFVHSDNSQFSNLQGALSVWHDLRETLNQLKSKDGKVYVAEATTSVTVHDHPGNVKAIANYLHDLNRNLSRQVALQVQVLEISLKRGFNYGVNWDVVRKIMDINLGLKGGLGQNAAFQMLGNNISATTTGAAAGFIIQGSGRWEGTNTLINALNQQGNVSTVTRPRVVTLNNQVAEIDINMQTGYLKQVSTTQTTNAGTTSALTPGTVKTGFTLFLLPKIQGNKIYLQVSSTISNLLGISTIESNPGVANINSNQIQLPTVMEKRFNQRSLVPSGATLVLAGFKQLNNVANRSQMFGSQALGGKGATIDNTETIILITPTILKR